MTYRDDNEIMKTLISVIEEYDGFVMGIGSKNDFYSFNTKGVKKPLEIPATEVKKATIKETENIVGMRRAFFASLLDTSIGSYYTADIISGKGVVGSKNPADLSRLNEYISILADTKIGLPGEQIPVDVLLSESDAKSKMTDVSGTTKASMRKMTREYQTEMRTKIDDLWYIGEEDIDEAEIFTRIETLQASNNNATWVDELSEDSRDELEKEFIIPSSFKEIVNEAGNLSRPSLTNPKMSAFVIKDHEFNYDKRRVEFLSLFFNGITPIEMSRCVPYIDITFTHRHEGTHSENFLNSTAYMKFASNKADNNGKQDLTGFAGKTYPYHSEETDTYSSDVSYMNLFTSPQTMVNADINGEESKWGLGSFKTNSYNSALDPFAPQATLSNLTLTTLAGKYGMQSSKEGNMTITIHDRSRLKLFAPIVAINQLSSSRVKITYGWSHPDGNVDSDNPIGRFLDSMKVTGVYSLLSSNLRFEGNSVEASLEIKGLGNQHINEVSAAAGLFVPLRIIANPIKSIVNSLIAKKKDKVNGSKDTENIAYIHPQLELLIVTANSIETMVSAADYQDLLRKIKNNDHSDDAEKEIIIQVAKLIGIDTLGKDFETVSTGIKEETGKANVSLTNATISSAISNSNKKSTAKILREKYKTLFAVNKDKHQYQPDYFTKNCLVKGAKVAESNPLFSNEYVSLGKFIANFVGAPMISTGEYSEVQMFFYPLNSAAGGARIHTTASLPLKKDELDSIFETTPETNEDIDKADSSISLGTATCTTMISKITGLLQSLEIDAYGLVEVGAKAQALSIKKVFKKASNDKDIRETYLRNYYSKTKSFTEDLFQINFSAYEAKTDQAEKDNILKTAIATMINEKASGNKDTLLGAIYNSDGLGATDVNTFRFPQLQMHLEVLPAIRPITAAEIPWGIRNFGAKDAVYGDQTDYAKGKILRIHITDQACIGPAKIDLANQILFDGNKDISANQVTAPIISNGINNLSDAELKEYIKRHYATIIYGAGSSTIKRINISSLTTDKNANAKMHTQMKNERSKTVTKNVNTAAESIRMVPASVDVQMLGCPMVERGNTFFIDMGTNTDLDNCYVVDSVIHTLSQGEFTTSLSLSVGNQGTIVNTRGSIIHKLSTMIDPKNKT